VRWIKLTKLLLPAISLLLASGLANADPNIVFGPQTYERTTGTVDLYTNTFEMPVAGSFVMILHNGDHEGSRVDAGTVRVNGLVAAEPSELNEQAAGLRKAVELQAGVNQVEVELMGDPGSFVTMAIVHPGGVPLFAQGRLVLPWGRNDASRALALALKNGSTRFPRGFRVIFFRPNGEVAGASDRIMLPPRGSLVIGADQLLDNGDWTVGSIEVFYAGPGTARMFGSARHLNLPLGDFDVEPLEQAGLRVQRARPGSLEPTPSRADRR
jgi:hypothetical protein